MKAHDTFSIAVNPYPRALDGSDRVVYSHMVYLTREEDDMDKDEILKKIMSHAVRGHTKGGEEWHTFCNDPKHALDILAKQGMTIDKDRRTLEEARMEESAENEGMPVRYAPQPVDEFPEDRKAYSQATHELLS